MDGWAYRQTNQKRRKRGRRRKRRVKGKGEQEKEAGWGNGLVSKCLLLKPQNLNPNPQHTRKELGAVVHICNLSAGGMEAGGSLKLDDQPAQKNW